MRTHALVLALAGFGSLWSCSSGTEQAGVGAGPQPPNAIRGTIAGRVTGPVFANLTVELSGVVARTVATDASGAYRFVDLPPGAYRVTPLRSAAAHFTPASASVTSNGDDLTGIDFVTNVPLNVIGFAPTDIGDELWAWAWAGEDGANLTMEAGSYGPSISFMLDLSGNANHFFNNTNRKAGYRVGVQIDASHPAGPYATSLPLIGHDRWPGGADHFGSVYYQSRGMGATADFYLACAMTNTRTGGQRELFGTDDHDVVRLNQQDGHLYLKIAGAERRIANGSVPHGPLVVEIWRDQAGAIKVLVNQVDVTDGAITMHGEFDVSGFGFDQTGTSYYDDNLFELVYCDALPPVGERDQIREYLRQKWGLY